MSRARLAAVIAAAALAAAACSGADANVSAERSADRPALTTTSSTTTTTTSTTTTTTAPPATAAPTTTTTTTTTTTEPPRPSIPRVVVETGLAPFATIGDVVLTYPATHIELTGFHESAHDGAREMTPAQTAARTLTLETRDRGTGARTAADIVVVPDTTIFAPVTGTVVRTGGYTLYCDYSDEFVVIEPDDRPGWEVKVLHIENVQIADGQRVEAAVTPIAARSRPLAFESQVDEHTAEPSSPHVHIEVVDPTIPDRPTPGGGCS